MSFWGKLAKIGLIGAAPFTGGASLAGLPLVDPIDNGISAIVDKSKGMPQVGVDANGNPVNAPTNQANANEAQALINNRARQATIDQGGPAADRLAMQNQFRAGLAARMGANPITLPGLRLANGQMIASPDLTPTTAGTDFANLFQQKMLDRAKNGQSLTLSGVPAPSQEEIDANKKALDAAGVGTWRKAAPLWAPGSTRSSRRWGTPSTRVLATSSMARSSRTCSRTADSPRTQCSPVRRLGRPLRSQRPRLTTPTTATTRTTTCSAANNGC